jgi:hypothetical protein
MAELAATTPTGAGEQSLPAGWWPVDILIGAYLTGMAVLIGNYAGRVPGSGWLLAGHAAGLLLIAAGARSRGRLASIFRHWYPLLYVGALYREMALVIPAVWKSGLDVEVARWERALWGGQPVLWLERLHNPWLAEFLQLAYALFLPAVLLVPWLLWRRGRLEEFRSCAFLISLGFLTSYRSFDAVRQLLDQLESPHYDCFPSGHVEMTLLAWWASRGISKNLFRGLFVYSGVVVFATAYLRYHYTVDVMAGAALAALVWKAAPYLSTRKRLAVGTS